MSYEKRIEELGLKIPEAPKPVAAYIPAVKVDNLVFTSGQIPFVHGELLFRGKVGGDLSEEEGYQAAKVCALNCLSVIKGLIGSLDRIEKIVKVTGYVNSAPGFTRQPLVINGASELLADIFGEAGQHARAAIGVSELPVNAAVEVDMVVKVKASRE
ncbi:MAG: RidA family protein [Bacillota bacterium]